MKQIISLITLMLFVFSSCGDDNHIPDNKVSLGNNGNGNIELPDPKDEMRQAVKAHVSEYSEYKNFCFYITIKTTLSEEYPDKYFKYGIEMGYGSYDYYVYATGYDDTYSVEQPVYIFAEGSPYFMYSFNWKTYQSLLEDMNNGPLSDSEKSLYNETVKILKKDEANAKSSFIYRVFVDVDNDRYYL